MNKEVTQAPKHLSYDLELPPLIERAAEAVHQRAQALTIASDQDYIKVADFAADARREWDSTEKQRAKMKAPALEAARGVDDHFRPALKFLDDAIKVAKAKLIRWDNHKKELAAAEQRRLEDAKRKEREEAEAAERRKQEALRAEEQKRREAAEAAEREANAKRVAAEQEARREAAKREAAEAQAAGDRQRAADAERAQKDAETQAERARADAASEREKAIEARRLQLKAERETTIANAQAEAARNTAAAPVQEVRPEVTAGAGVARKTTWKARVTDLAQVDRKWLCFDQAKADAFAQKNGAEAASFMGAGIEVYSEESIAVRSKRA